MRILLLLCIIASFAFSFTFSACKSSSKRTFCDTTCLKDSIKFNSKFDLEPYVYISAKDCKPDELIWSYSGMGVNRKVGLAYLLNNTVYLHKDNVRCFINDTSYAWLLFNDCVTGRGYSLKLPFNKTQDIGRKSSSINSIDPKFAVADGMVAYSDRGNIFVEEMKTGKKEMMTFGKNLDTDYDVIHDYIDSVNITPTRIWVRIKIDGKWEDKEKNITLK